MRLRLANRYGLFARMTNVRYEIEFEASLDGQTWLPYPFKYKPQAPRFSTGNLRSRISRDSSGICGSCAVELERVAPRYRMQMARLSCPWVLATEARLLERSPHVLALFQDDPLHGTPPRYVRASLWQYWMTTPAVLRETGHYWRRQRLGTYIDVAENP